MTAIVSKINEPAFFSHLKSLFTTSATVLAELMQNARRAEANQVAFEYKASDETLTVVDDGNGVDDFQALITVAGSGWSQEVMDSERPFGMGFLAVSFAARHIRVESRGHKIEFSSEDLIEKRPIPILSSDFGAGTRITLFGCHLSAERIGNALAEYAMGFAIPVLWNGGELDRPHAQAKLSGAETPVGFIHVPGVHDGSGMGFKESGYVYCQGLPVSVTDMAAFSMKRCGSRLTRPVVHIDHAKYQPRMPDRDKLIDSDEAAKDIAGAIRTIWREHLETKKASMTPLAFASACWEDARQAGCFDLLEDSPVLPASVLWQISEMPVLTDYVDEFTERATNPVTREEVESGAVLLFWEYPEHRVGEQGDAFLRLSWALMAENVYFISPGNLPDKHWAHAYLRSLAKERVSVDGNVVAEDYFFGSWIDGQIRVMENMTVTLDGLKYPLTHPVSMKRDDNEGTVFLVPKGAVEPGYVLRQVSQYINDCGYYVENDYETDAEDFAQQIAIMVGESPVVTLTKSLHKGGVQERRNLRNQAFRVKFDADGKMTVTPAE